MGLHIEINGDLSPREWEAVAALVAAMRAPVAAVNAAPLPSPDIAALKAAVPVATAVEAPTAPTAPTAPPAPVPAPPVPADLEATLMAAAARNVSAVPAPPVEAPPGVVLDAAGLPWDARIHGSTKTTNKDGTWRGKRNVDPNMVAAVEAELRAALAAPGAPAPTLDPAAAFGTLDPAAAFGTPQPEAPAAPAPPVAATNAFAEFMKRVVAKQAAKTVTTEMTVEIAKSFGLSSIRDLAARPDLIPAFEAALP